MGEPLGLVKVIVVQGKRLAVRDFKSSDPYVILKLGNQVLYVFFIMFFVEFVDSITSFVLDLEILNMSLK